MVDRRYHTCENCGAIYMFVHVCPLTTPPRKPKSVKKEVEREGE